MSPQLQRKNIILMIFLQFITYGIYFPVWLRNRQNALNELNSKEKISDGIVVFLLIASIASAILLIPSVLYMETSTGDLIDNIDNIINAAIVIAVIITSFKIMKILNDHYNTKLSKVATFFFSFFYLQHEINQHLKKTTPPSAAQSG